MADVREALELLLKGMTKVESEPGGPEAA